MTIAEKTNAIIEFLMTCPNVTGSPFYFNFAEIADGNTQLVKDADKVGKTYIDGSQLKYYTFTIVSYKAVAHNPLVDEPGFIDENISNLAKVQEVIDWVNQQDEDKNYPNFGENCVIDEMKCLTEDPNLNGVDTKQNPPLAKYAFTIKIQYLDNSKAIQ